MKFSIIMLECSVLVGGCVAKGGVKVSSDSVFLTKSEIEQLLVGNTFPLSKGGMYFSSDKEATVNWEGKNEDTQWYANDSSEFCYTVDLFAGKEECLGLKKSPSGDFVRVFEGKTTQVKATDMTNLSAIQALLLLEATAVGSITSVQMVEKS